MDNIPTIGFRLPRVKPEDRQTVVMIVSLALAGAALAAAIHLLLYGSIL